ncbi:hypothetical protein Hanom_Chr05g00445171 [Helianthus anomalus]
MSDHSPKATIETIQYTNLSIEKCSAKDHLCLYLLYLTLSNTLTVQVPPTISQLQYNSGEIPVS